MTIREAIEELKKMAPDAKVYFDCAFCGRANIFQRVTKVVLIGTQSPPVKAK